MRWSRSVRMYVASRSTLIHGPFLSQNGNVGNGLPSEDRQLLQEFLRSAVERHIGKQQ
jgi:hypothetical protein